VLLSCRSLPCHRSDYILPLNQSIEPRILANQDPFDAPDAPFSYAPATVANALKRLASSFGRSPADKKCLPCRWPLSLAVLAT